VVRYFGGVKLGSGGLVRAYTDSVAQALLKTEKVAIVKLLALRCSVPYALEGLIRRELEIVEASVNQVSHGDDVTFDFGIGNDAAAPLMARLSEAGNGRIIWSNDPIE
jgi:putative IMPACT (imprinted ancient) family translation regulator